MPEIAYVNGEFLPLEQATVRVEDRGFQFADGVYEVVRTYGGKPFATDEHLARLARSLDAIELKNPLSVEKGKSIIDEGIRRSGFAEATEGFAVGLACLDAGAGPLGFANILGAECAAVAIPSYRQRPPAPPP